jgi:hypothetical protein
MPLFPIFTEDGAPVAEASSVPLGPRPRADDLGRLGSGPPLNQLSAGPLRADQESGTLAADGNAGTLIHPAPKRTGPKN